MSMPVVMSEGSELLKPTYARRGFLPDVDPLAAFPCGFALRRAGRDRARPASLLHDKGFRAYARALHIPKWEDPVSAETLPQLRLYYVRVGFLASAYVNQVGEEPADDSPAQPRRTSRRRGEAARAPADPEL